MTTSAAPFHVLLLSGGHTTKPQHKKAGSGSGLQEVVIYDENVHDDYLHRRHEFRKKSELRLRKNTSLNNAPTTASAKSSVGVENSPSAVVVGDGDVVNKDASIQSKIASLRKVASRLELAMAACCERPSSNSSNNHTDRDDAGGGKDGGSGGAFIRPVFPANYTAPDSPREEKVRHQRQRHHHNHGQQNSELQSATSTSMMGINGNNSVGILQSGKEGHFLKLLLMYCPKHALGHRALAVAILQRTVDSESTISKKEKDAQADAKPLDNEQSSTNRIKLFLSAGGMKLLSRWLVESYTAIPAPSPPSPVTSSNKFHTLQNKQTQQQRAMMASPTGPLLLPILHLLKVLPFDKELVVASQIHKAIKRLKKALTAVVNGLEDNSMLEGVLHPIAGGCSVKKVIEAVDLVMDAWTKAAAATPSPVKSSEGSASKVDAGDKTDGDADKSSIDGDGAPNATDPFHNLQNRIQNRFNELVEFQSREYSGSGGEPPEWLPKSILGVWRATKPQVKQPQIKLHPLANAPNAISSPLSVTKPHVHMNRPMSQFGAKSDQDKRATTTTAATAAKPGPLFLGKRKGGTSTTILGSTRQQLAAAKHLKLGRNLHPSPSAASASAASASKRVSWTDRPLLGKGLVPGPLKEERLYVRDSQVLSSSPLAQQQEEVPSVTQQGTVEETGGAMAAVGGDGDARNDEEAARSEAWEAVAVKTEEEDGNNHEDEDDDSDMEDLF